MAAHLETQNAEGSQMSTSTADKLAAAKGEVQ